MSVKDMDNEIKYKRTVEILDGLRDKCLISADIYIKIEEKYRKKLMPYLAEVYV